MKEYKTTEEKENEEIDRVAKEVLSDKEYKELLRQTRGGRPCDGCEE